MKIGEVLKNSPRNLRTKDVSHPPRILGKTQQSTNKTADYLVMKYNAPNYRPAFLKIAWRLEESIIGRIVEASFGHGIKSPRAYFITASKREESYID